MMRVWAVYCILCWVVAAMLLAASLLHRISLSAAARRERRFAKRYMHIITSGILDGEGIPMARFPMCERRGAREVLARLLAEASSSTFFEEPGAVRRMVAANGVEGWLLRRIRHSRGYVRARYLAMLSSLPVSHSTAACIDRFSSSRDRFTLFRTMLVRIAAEPSSAVRLLSEFPYPLTHFEMAELTSMLRRGLLPLAYAPLLVSENRNLRMLGLNIVRLFGITESEHRLLAILSDEDVRDEEFRDETVYILASLHLSVSRNAVVEHIRSMKPERRRALFRRLASEGYSVAALMRLAEGEEQLYIESLVASYKRTLVCHSRI